MKKFFVLILLTFALPQAAWACSTLQTTTAQMDQTLLARFGEFAKALGVACPVFYDQSSDRATRIHYVPEDQTFADWSQMLTVTAIDTGHSDSGSATLPLTNTFLQRIRSLGGKAEVISEIDTHNASSSQHGIWYVIRYSLGEGESAEDSVALIRTLGLRQVATLLFQQRVTPLLEDSLQTFLQESGVTPRTVR